MTRTGSRCRVDPLTPINTTIVSRKGLEQTAGALYLSHSQDFVKDVGEFEEENRRHRFHHPGLGIQAWLNVSTYLAAKL